MLRSARFGCDCRAPFSTIHVPRCEQTSGGARRFYGNWNTCPPAVSRFVQPIAGILLAIERLQAKAPAERENVH